MVGNAGRSFGERAGGYLRDRQRASFGSVGAVLESTMKVPVLKRAPSIRMSARGFAGKPSSFLSMDPIKASVHDWDPKGAPVLPQLRTPPEWLGKWPVVRYGTGGHTNRPHLIGTGVLHGRFWSAPTKSGGTPMHFDVIAGGHSIDETVLFHVPSSWVRHEFLRQHMDRDFTAAAQARLTLSVRSFIPWLA